MTGWDKTITLYNRYEDELTGVVRWYRHRLCGCFYKRTNSTVNVGGVQLQTDGTIVRIPVQSGYLPPYVWNMQTNDRRGTQMTLQSGDLIFLGDISEEIDEYSNGKRANDLISKYNALGSIFVKSVNVNTSLPGKHYLVKGE